MQHAQEVREDEFFQQLQTYHDRMEHLCCLGDGLIMEFCTEIVSLSDDLCTSLTECSAKCIDYIGMFRDDLECFRVENHAKYSSSLVSADLGWSLDTAIFFTVLSLDKTRCEFGYLVQSNCYYVSCADGRSSSITGVENCSYCAALVYTDKPVFKFTIEDVQLSYAAAALNSRHVTVDASFAHYVSMLQWRLEHLLFTAQLKTPDSVVTVGGMPLARYACMTARAKQGVLHWHQLMKNETDMIAANACFLQTVNQVAPDQSDSDIESDFTDSSIRMSLTRLFEQWAAKQVSVWDGSRLRSAVITGMRKRDIRLDEAGEVVSLAGSVPMRRAKGSLQACEELLSTFSCQDFMLCSRMHGKHQRVSQSVGQVGVVRDLLLLKLFANCLELHGVDFLGNHLYLNSLSDMWNWAALPVLDDAKYVVVESIKGWGVADSTKRYHPCNGLDECLAMWYALFFGELDDPLGMWKRECS